MRRWNAERPPNETEIEVLAALLRDGAVALLPTDTIYGLHAMVASDEAVQRIRRIKGRDGDKPFVTLAASAEQLEASGVIVPEALRDLWPAPLTAVMHRGGTTVAARVPALPWLRQLLERSGPLVSTSANLSGEPPISRPDQLSDDFLTTLDAVFDAGLLAGEPSAIVDFTSDEPRLIRAGENSFTQKLRKTLRISL